MRLGGLLLGLLAGAGASAEKLGAHVAVPLPALPVRGPWRGVHPTPPTSKHVALTLRGGGGGGGGGGAVAPTSVATAGLKMGLQAGLTAMNIACWLGPLNLKGFTDNPGGEQT